VETVTEMSYSISETALNISQLGFMAVASAAYLICSATILFFFIKWFVRIIDNIIERQLSTDDLSRPGRIVR
jgi:hypothetical protein